MKNRAWWTTLLLLAASTALAADAVCVRIRLVIPQRLTMERDAFDASLDLTNNLTDAPLTSLSVAVRFRTMDGVPADSLFFLQPSPAAGITGGLEGGGVIAPATTGQARWLIIPTVGAGGLTPGGQQYFVKAVLQYQVNGVPFTTETFEELITVQPQPELILDYALPRRVKADDPFTPELEPVIPFELALRVSNVGAGPARNLRVVSAQPRIIENLTGALIDFQILGTFRNDESITNTLAIPFGTLPPGACGVGAWAMTASLRGEFTEMSATFEHREELGGALTSLIRQARTNWLIHRIQMDIPGRDNVPDALIDLAASNDGLPDKIQDSQCGEQDVTVVPATVMGAPDAQNPTVTVTATVQPQWIYFVVPDPGMGRYPIRRVERVRDGRVLHLRNAWLHEDTTVDPPAPQLAFVDFSQFGGVPEVYRVTLDFSEFDVTPPVSFLDPLPPFVGSNPLYVTPTTVMVARALDDLSGVALVEYRRDGGPWRAAAPFYIPTPGQHLVELRATDVRGNVEPVQAITVHVDGSAPQVTVLSPTPGATYLRGQAITVDITALDLDPNPLVTLRLRPTGGGDAIPILDGQVLDANTLAVGSYVIESEATDWLGQTAAATTQPFLVQDTPGACVNVPDGVLCDDFNPCTVDDTCLAAACGGVPNTCDDNNSCTSDSCELPGGCVHTPDVQGSCDDQDACTGNDQCQSGTCVGQAITCDDQNPCTSNSCNPATGCVYAPAAGSCSDGDACTSNDTCTNGTCVGQALGCDDNNPCTADSCSPMTGCAHTPVTGSCDDGNACTGNDTCQGGTCTGGTTAPAGTACDDQDPCTAATSCNASGQCVGTAVTCGGGGTCNSNTCCGTTAVDCNDNDPCTADSCAADGGCEHAMVCADGGVTADAGTPDGAVALDGGAQDGAVAQDAGGPDAAVTSDGGLPQDAGSPDAGRRDGGTATTDGAVVMPGEDAGTGGGGEEPKPRCGCSVAGDDAADPVAGLALVVAGLWAVTRRRRGLSCGAPPR